MTIIFKIKIIMTLAMVFYAIAIFLGTKQRKYQHSKWIHGSFATIGFSLDMWATYMMETLRTFSIEISLALLWGHTIISTLAIIIYFLMLYFGLTHKIKIHKKVIWYAFIPIWLLAYLTGIIIGS